MEKKIGSKEVKMTPSTQQEKLSYEDLNKACIQLSQQNKQMDEYIQKMRAQMQQMVMDLQTKRLDYLFKVLELSAKNGWEMFHNDFVIKCAQEIEESLTIPEETEKDNKEG